MNINDFNAHNKEEYAPAHTAEHLLNQTMIRKFGCGRAIEAHIERKKSKMDFSLDKEPTSEEVESIEETMNKLIADNLDVTFEYSTQAEMEGRISLDRLPENASENIRIVKIGDYDACACIGKHVNNTAEIGGFKIASTSYSNGIWRIRWKISATL